MSKLSTHQPPAAPSDRPQLSRVVADQSTPPTAASRALPRRLGRDIAIVLAVKFAIVIAAAVFVFAPSKRPAIDATALTNHFLTDTPK